MTKQIVFATALTLALTATSAAKPGADAKALENLPVQFTAAWATHDGKALAAIMADDVDFITVGGTWYHGKADFELYHSRLLSGRFRDATMTMLERKANFVRRDLGIVRWSWTISGDKNIDGTLRAPRVGIMTMLAEKRRGRWLVIAAQNTNGMPGKAPEEEGIVFPITLPDPSPN